MTTTRTDQTTLEVVTAQLQLVSDVIGDGTPVTVTVDHPLYNDGTLLVIVDGHTVAVTDDGDPINSGDRYGIDPVRVDVDVDTENWRWAFCAADEVTETVGVLL